MKARRDLGSKFSDTFGVVVIGRLLEEEEAISKEEKNLRLEGETQLT